MDPKRDGKTPAVLTVLTTIGFFAVLAWLITHGLPESGRDVILVMIGTLGTGWTACLGYYVGSSSGSALKTAAMERMAGGGQGG
jgi:hypothetical protein